MCRFVIVIVRFTRSGSLQMLPFVDKRYSLSESPPQLTPRKDSSSEQNLVANKKENQYINKKGHNIYWADAVNENVPQCAKHEGRRYDQIEQPSPPAHRTPPGLGVGQSSCHSSGRSGLSGGRLGQYLGVVDGNQNRPSRLSGLHKDPPSTDDDHRHHGQDNHQHGASEESGHKTAGGRILLQ